MSRRSIWNTLFIIPLLFCLSVLFQNCSSSNFNFFNPKQANDNGGAYGGMIRQLYRYSNPAQPCNVQDLNGSPLPNEAILFRADANGNVGPYLARHSCQDITPIALSSGEVQVDSSMSSLSYQGQVFSMQNPPGSFDIAVAACPAGKTPISGATRTNSFASPMDWTALQTVNSPGWYIFPGIDVSLYSTLASLPGYQIQRNDANNLDYWRRDTQGLQLQANTDYAFSFLAQSGTVSAADFTFYRGIDPSHFNFSTDENVVVTFDFQAVTATVVTSVNIKNVSAVISPVGNGFLCTVYFTSSSVDSQSPVVSMGVGPSTKGQSFGKLGDSIIATDAQLVPVNQFCQ